MPNVHTDCSGVAAPDPQEGGCPITILILIVILIVSLIVPPPSALPKSHPIKPDNADSDPLKPQMPLHPLLRARLPVPSSFDVRCSTFPIPSLRPRSHPFTYVHVRSPNFCPSLFAARMAPVDAGWHQLSLVDAANAAAPPPQAPWLIKAHTPLRDACPAIFQNKLPD